MSSVQYIPRATEKAYTAQTRREYMFFVPLKASKQEIAKQIGEAFKVTVIDVRTATRKGKQTKYSKGKHAYPGITYRRDHKVAYITLKDGDKIPVFEEPAKESRVKNSKADSSEAKPENLTTKSADKKADKKDAKAEKKAAKAEKKTAKKEEKESK